MMILIMIINLYSVQKVLLFTEFKYYLFSHEKHTFGVILKKKMRFFY